MEKPMYMEEQCPFLSCFVPVMAFLSYLEEPRHMEELRYIEKPRYMEEPSYIEEYRYIVEPR